MSRGKGPSVIMGARQDKRDQLFHQTKRGARFTQGHPRRINFVLMNFISY